MLLPAPGIIWLFLICFLVMLFLGMLLFALLHSSVVGMISITAAGFMSRVGNQETTDDRCRDCVVLSLFPIIERL